MIIKTRLQGEALSRFEAELDALRREVLDDVGERDARHIQRMRGIVQGSAIAGRGLLMFGVGPFSWVAGVIGLALAKILETRSRAWTSWPRMSRAWLNCSKNFAMCLPTSRSNSMVESRSRVYADAWKNRSTARSAPVSAQPMRVDGGFPACSSAPRS